MTVHVRLAEPTDASEVHAVTRASFAMGAPVDPPSGAVSETLEDVAADLAATGGVVGELDGRVVASLRFRGDADAVWLRRIGVLPEYRRAGIGARLVTFAHAELARRPGVAELRVGVRHARPGAERFWVGLGYARRAEHGHWTELARRPPLSLDVPTAEDMRALGQRLARVLRPGDMVIAIGGLGAGKTTLAQGLGGGLHVVGAVTSPTFVLAREHRAAPGGVPLVHVDAYRLGAVADPLSELDTVDLDATLDTAVTFVEWGEGLVERLTTSRVEVRIEADAESERRRVLLDALGPRWQHVDLAGSLG